MGWGGTRLKQRVSGDPRRGLTLLEYQGKEPTPQFLPTGSPRTWWAVGRAKRNLLVLWFTVWRMDDKRLTRQVWCRQLPGASQPQPSGTQVPSATPQLTVLSSSRSRYFSLGSRSVIRGRRDLRTSPSVRYRDPGIQGGCKALRGGVGGESPWSGPECREPEGAESPGAGYGARVSPSATPSSRAASSTSQPAPRSHNAPRGGQDAGHGWAGPG
ncbi:hypothetical protein DBR06_SOUSAS6810168, partial [Sousa chinensis]